MENLFNIMYVAPRYHTNQVPIINGWHKSGAKVKFMAAYTGVIESHENVDFYQMKPSIFIRMILYFMSFLHDKDELQYLQGKYFIPNIRDLYRQLKSFKPDVVIIRNYSLMAMTFIFVCRILGIKNIVMYLQEPLYGKPMKSNILKDFVRKRFFPHAVFTPVLYKGECRSKEKLSNRAKYFVPLVCDKTEDRSTGYCANGKIRILDIGKYRDYKNHFFVVDALSKVKHPDKFEVTIIGQLSSKAEQDYHDRLEQYIRDNHLENVIHTRGHVDFKEMDAVYANNDVLLLASKNETAGIVILEAMSKGLCVISDFNCGLTCYIDEYLCGLSFSEKNVSCLVEVLDKIAENDSIVTELGQKAQKTAKEEFCFEKYRESLNELLKTEYNYSIKI